MENTPPSAPPICNNVTFFRPDFRMERPVPELRRPLQKLVDELGPELASSELPAFLVVAIRGRTQRRRTLVTLDDGHLVVGRHTESDLYLDADPSVSLRHLLIRALHLDDGTPALRILDLDTKAGFRVDGGDDVRSLVATGPFAIAVGEWVIAGIPHGRPMQLPRGAGGPYRLAAPVLHHAERVPGQTDSDVRRSHITLLPRVDWIGAPSSVSLVARLQLSSRRGKNTLPITQPMVDRGVLVGRYERCVGQGALAITTGTVSRTHALILRDGPADRIFDLASTGGTFLDGRRIRSAALSRSGSCVRLASDDPVHMYWSALSS
ncbi:MAG: FHA domain-containing protein [Deltaproteobacteria bacterium]|nr:FHA domain-containing protein [Deltaproteobacteria bacterium]